jgi:hypothetical protein
VEEALSKAQGAVLLASARSGTRLLLCEPGAVHCGGELVEPVSEDDMQELQRLGYVRKLEGQRRAYAVTQAGALWGSRRLVDEPPPKER